MLGPKESKHHGLRCAFVLDWITEAKRPGVVPVGVGHGDGAVSDGHPEARQLCVSCEWDFHRTLEAAARRQRAPPLYCRKQCNMNMLS